MVKVIIYFIVFIFLITMFLTCLLIFNKVLLKFNFDLVGKFKNIIENKKLKKLKKLNINIEERDLDLDNQEKEEEKEKDIYVK